MFIGREAPPDFTKPSDTRSRAFVAKYGDIAVELDALPVDVRRARIITEIESRIDLAALRRVQALELRERQQLAETLARLDG